MRPSQPIAIVREAVISRRLSSRAFNQHGDDAELYNGIHDLETACLALLEYITALDSYTQLLNRWQEHDSATREAR